MNDDPSYLRNGMSPDMVEAFTRFLLDSDDSAAADLIARLCEEGVPAEAIMLDLFAPAARLLGEMWCCDDANFLDVTLGLGRIHRLLRQLQMPGPDGPPRGSVLLLPVPGEQHVLGLRIVEEFLLRAGWRVKLAMPEDMAAVRRLLADTPFDIVGLAISGDRLLPILHSVIKEIRTMSRNRDVRIMVGGITLHGKDDAALGIAADAVIRDAQGAVDQANSWYGLVRAD